MTLRSKLLLAFVLLLIVAASVLVLRSSLRKAQFARQVQSMQAAEADELKALPRSLQLSSPDLASDGQYVPALTCRGAGRSPALAWSNVPMQVQSYVLMMVDWDSPTPQDPPASFTHWLLYNIPSPTVGLAAGVSDAQLRQSGIEAGENSLGTRTYLGLCPPAVHRYRLRLFALDVAHIAPATPGRTAVAAAMAGHVLAFGELEGRFGD